MSFFGYFDHVHLREVLGSAVEVLAVRVLDWPTHVDWCMHIYSLYSCSSFRSYGQEEAEQALPSASASEFEVVVTPEEHMCFVVDLAARA